MWCIPKCFFPTFFIFPTRTGLLAVSTHILAQKLRFQKIFIKQHDKDKRKAPKLSDLVKTSSMNLNKETGSMIHEHRPSHWLSSEALAGGLIGHSSRLRR